MKALNAISWITCVLSVAGAALTAWHSPGVRFSGFVLFLLANVLFLFWAWRKREAGIGTMQAIFILTSILGLWSNRPPW